MLYSNLGRAGIPWSTYWWVSLLLWFLFMVCRWLCLLIVSLHSFSCVGQEDCRERLEDHTFWPYFFRWSLYQAYELCVHTMGPDVTLRLHLLWNLLIKIPSPNPVMVGFLYDVIWEVGRGGAAVSILWFVLWLRSICWIMEYKFYLSAEWRSC